MTEVVAALIWDKNRFMICQRPATKSCALLWEFVGGKVEPDETKARTTENHTVKLRKRADRNLLVVVYLLLLSFLQSNAGLMA